MLYHKLSTKLLLSPQFNVQGVSFEVPDLQKPDNLLVFDFETVTVDRRGQIIKRETKQASYFVENLGNNIELEMVYIPGGKFMMGSPENEKGRSKDESPQHEVTVRSFFMGKYPITQAQWRTIVNQVPKIQRDLYPDPSRFKGDNRPVERISWKDAVEFCARLSKYTGQIYRLPSEAEWEYACRAGTTTPFHFGETITGELANYRASKVYAQETPGKPRNQTTPVGSFKVANAFGLYDLHGNVWEWCADPWHPNYERAPNDGSVSDENNNDNWYKFYNNDYLVNLLNDKRSRVLRGGSWVSYPRSCRSAYRDNLSPGDVYGRIGFRVVRIPPMT